MDPRVGLQICDFIWADGEGARLESASAMLGNPALSSVSGNHPDAIGYCELTRTSASSSTADSASLR